MSEHLWHPGLLKVYSCFQVIATLFENRPEHLIISNPGRILKKHFNDPMYVNFKLLYVTNLNFQTGGVQPKRSIRKLHFKYFQEPESHIYYPFVSSQ